jgi:hypothetical protein
MTAREFRKMALALPEAVEDSHMGHPDFRVRNKIFATLGPDESWGMVKLNSDEQTSFVSAAPEAFQPASGAWGRRGCTIVLLAEANGSKVRQGLVAAWRNTAPKRLVQEHEAE